MCVGRLTSPPVTECNLVLRDGFHIRVILDRRLFDLESVIALTVESDNLTEEPPYKYGASACQHSYAQKGIGQHFVCMIVPLDQSETELQRDVDSRRCGSMHVAQNKHAAAGHRLGVLD